MTVDWLQLLAEEILTFHSNTDRIPNFTGSICLLWLLPSENYFLQVVVLQLKVILIIFHYKLKKKYSKMIKIKLVNHLFRINSLSL